MMYNNLTPEKELTMQHPIEPSSELVSQCMEMFRSGACFEAICRVSAQWGADLELEACCSYFEDHLREGLAIELRLARRPKPPSLKEQALEILEINNDVDSQLSAVHYNTIRRALEALPND